jgi:microcin C transport system permease protein
MRRYLLKRLLLVPITLFAIIALNFCLVQFAPGGPVEALLAQPHLPPGAGLYRGGTGLDDAARAQLAAQFGFDEKPLTRFGHMLRDYLSFNLGTSYFQGVPVAALIRQRLPVSLALGLWSTLLAYLIAIPLGVAKAARNGGRFDAATSTLVLALYAVPGFLLTVLLMLLFGQGGAWPLFPLRGLASPGAATWPWPARLMDFTWHMVLPTAALTAGGLATLTLLMKNAVLEEAGKLYVLAARAKGLGERRVLLRHVLPNALLLIIATLPGAFTAILFGATLLVEIIFSINGLGLLGYQAVLQRDYPVMFGTLYVYTLAGLLARIAGDMLLAWADPRIDFEARR